MLLGQSGLQPILSLQDLQGISAGVQEAQPRLALKSNWKK